MRLSQRAGPGAVVAIAITMVLASATYAAAPNAGGGPFGPLLSPPQATPPLSVAALVASEEAVLTRQGISPARARQALILQGQIAEAHLPLRIETALGDAYAGVWFDPAAAKFDVGVTSNASRQAVRQAVARTGLANDVVETPVRSTWGALVAVQEEWNTKLAKLLDAGDATTGIEAQHDAVAVTLSSSVSSQERAALKREAAAAGVSVVIRVVGPELRAARQVVCENPFTSLKARCEPTITAGAGWSCTRAGTLLHCDPTEAEELRATCTAGPMLIEGNETYMLTAGHCLGLKSPAGGTAFTAPKVLAQYTNFGAFEEIGKEGRLYENTEHDVAEVKVARPGPFTSELPTPVPARMAEWSIKPAAPSTVTRQEAVSSAIPLQMVCHEGMKSGERCGQVVSLNVTFDGTRGLVKTNACSEGGDSGGPYVFGTEAAKAPLLVMGTHVAGTPSCPMANSETYFEPLVNLPAPALPLGTLGLFELSRNQRLLTTNNETRRAAGTVKAQFKVLPTSKKVTLTGITSEWTSTSIKVVCSSSLGEGEVSTETIGKISITFNSCMGSKGSEECTVKSIGAKSEGEIVTKTLKGELGNVASSEAHSEVGLLLEPETAKKVVELTGKCIPSPVTIEGKLAGEVSPVDASTLIGEIEFAATSSKPVIKAITVKAGNVKPKLEVSGLEADLHTYVEAEFAGDVEVV